MQKKKKINLPVVMGSIIIIFFVVIALWHPILLRMTRQQPVR